MALRKPPQPKGYDLIGPEPEYPDVPYAEWKARIDKVKMLMRESGIDMLVLWNDKNIRYFAGFTSVHWTAASIQPLVALIPVDSDPVVISGEFFRWTVEAQTWIRNIWCEAGCDEHSEEAVRALPRLVSAAIREMGYAKGSIALEMGSIGYMYIPRPLNDIQTFMNDLPYARFVAGDKVIWACRQIKSALEIERLEQAAAINRQAVSAVVQHYRPGMTEWDVGNLFICEAYQKGAEWVASGHIACGARKEGMFDTKHSFDGVAIQKEDYLHIDFFLTYKGYIADMARVLDVGPVSETIKKYHDQCWRAFDTVVEKVKPGMAAKQLHKILHEAGGIETLDELAGHGVGLDLHEPPMLTANAETILQPGMCFEVEPWLGSLRRRGGTGFVHLENLVVITDRGCLPVIGLPRGIIQVAHPF